MDETVILGFNVYKVAIGGGDVVYVDLLPDYLVTITIVDDD